MLRNYLIGLWRTAVNAGVVWIVTTLAALGVAVPDAVGVSLGVGFTGLGIVVYYAIVAALERRWPAFGWLLGKREAPDFSGPQRAAEAAWRQWDANGGQRPVVEAPESSAVPPRPPRARRGDADGV